MNHIYTRDYPERESVPEVNVPEHYSGTAFKEHDPPAEECGIHSDAEPTGGILGTLPFLGRIIPKGIFGNQALRGFKLGTEELLIIAVAAFLFFSKDGDRECALLLLALLFIT